MRPRCHNAPVTDADSILHSGKCSCGQVVFDLSTRRVGDLLDCSWCGRRYRFIGSDSMQRVSDTEKFDAKVPERPPVPAAIAPALPMRSAKRSDSGSDNALP